VGKEREAQEGEKAASEVAKAGEREPVQVKEQA